MSSRYLCGVPDTDCCGGKTLYGKNMALPPKSHASREEAFRCAASYLRKQDYSQEGLDARAFRPPDNGPVLILSKKSKFGARLRGGKRGGDSAGGSRFMPAGHRNNGLIYEAQSTERQSIGKRRE